MKMKITRLARARKCGNRAASGFGTAPAFPPNNPASAKYPNPHATDRSAFRRVMETSGHIPEYPLYPNLARKPSLPYGVPALAGQSRVRSTASKRPHQFLILPWKNRAEIQLISPARNVPNNRRRSLAQARSKLRQRLRGLNIQRDRRDDRARQGATADLRFALADLHPQTLQFADNLFRSRLKNFIRHLKHFDQLVQFACQIR